jgi:hypothetical protein
MDTPTRPFNPRVNLFLAAAPDAFGGEALNVVDHCVGADPHRRPPF